MKCFMLPFRKPRTRLFCLCVACLAFFLSAQIVEMPEYHGKKVTCVHAHCTVPRDGRAEGTTTHGYSLGLLSLRSK